MSSLPDNSLPGEGSSVEQLLSNLAHIPAYAILSILWIKSISSTTYIIAVFIAIFAISDEVHQSFIPGRTASLMDIVLDFIGILVGIGLLNLHS